jgi:hypothetical protein
VERLVALWCPGLSEEGPRGEEARSFARVLEVLTERCPFTEPVRRGVAIFPARGPSRFFGGEEAMVSLLHGDLEPLGERLGTTFHLGIAEGLFAALLAARRERIVTTGETVAFLAPLPVTTLRRPEMAVLCQRLGLPTLGHFASLSPGRVLERFGSDGAHCHRVARGEEGDLVGIRDASIDARLACLDEPPPPVAQPTFFGGTSLVDERAARAAIRLQQRLGHNTVQVAREDFGHDPNERAVLVPFGSREEDRSSLARRSAPWPGRLPSPSPTVVLETPLSVRLLDSAGAPVRVTARGLLAGAPDRCVLGTEVNERGVVAWAGPWPLATRWWDVRRFRARLQVITDQGEGLLLGFEYGQWWLLGRYD